MTDQFLPCGFLVEVNVPTSNFTLFLAHCRPSNKTRPSFVAPYITLRLIAGSGNDMNLTLFTGSM